LFGFGNLGKTAFAKTAIGPQWREPAACRRDARSVTDQRFNLTHAKEL
jgi:hypothetical protein